ncbi:hypothetical protein RD792_002111 [Penstemon davidsonii]|uniref:Carboxypeptidase n=1 Tax=Penstemon davidsonii TaxID=160366 RepID=A0ABR0DQ67_9LAMI|nr:hypothetical protein RD792_002111 [Penstemon davidsonii]
MEVGPGCSSFGTGAMTELGPFQDYITGDKQTAADTYTFLVNWLERFPEYKTRDFYITGESYAGHYVPQLAALILQNNKITNQTVINLKGIAIGNAYIDNEDFANGLYDYIWTHALISDEIHKGIVKNCNFSLEATLSKTCEEYRTLADNATSHVFRYDIDAPLCSSSNSTAPLISGFDPCSNDYVHQYLNTPQVQKALHANITKIPRPWNACSDYTSENWQWDDSPFSVLPTIRKLMASGISVWIYSGDTDGAVPVTTTKLSLTKLGARVKTPWYPWYNQGEVGGYAVEYENITFVTVRGAGHLVPSYQHERALTLFSSFLNGKLPPISVQCYDPLGELIKVNQRTKKLGNYHYIVEDDDLMTEYSPVYVAPQGGLKEADEILNQPGQPHGVSFSQYSGYVTVDPTAGRALFYYFTQSEDSSTNPLVLWLNGGPGCSSLGSGAMTELGPFRVNPDGKTLWHNENAWNNLANVIFLESPAGVGFSYSNRSSDYITGDKQTATDTYTFLVNWLERFPEYKSRDFYITGESYAGHYVPQLAALILQNNKSTNQTVINLKGIAIGNAYIDAEDEAKGLYDYIWTHALISDEVHEGIVKNCNFSFGATISQACEDYGTLADNAISHLYGYDIYAPLCSSNSSTPPLISGFDPCSRNYVHEYLNTPQVQKALHANVTGIPGPWNVCSNYTYDNWHDSPFTVLPTIRKLMASGISVWIYRLVIQELVQKYLYERNIGVCASGDTDPAVPITTTKLSLTKLGARIKTPWYPWYNQGEVGGYAVEYENITFVTVRGSGHFVPSYQPERALTLFASFLNGKLPPS